MNRLAALIQNFNMDCYKQYTKVSNYLGNILDISLKEIERFYYSDFWERRFRRRIKESNLKLLPYHLSIIQGTISELRDDVKFTLSNENSDLSGLSDTNNMIALNINMENLNDSFIKNIIMHEFGHLQYNLSEFNIIKRLNKYIIGTPGLYIKNNEILEGKDYPYFTDDNELRLRIVPIVKEMYDNNWAAEEAYELSENLKVDDIKEIFTKDYIIDLLNNIL